MQKTMPAVFFLILATLAVLPCPIPARADEAVTCRYLQQEGDEISVELNIKSPAPASVIIMQQLPPGIMIVSASPAPRKSNPAKGEAKWLLKGPQPGSLKISMHLDRPVRAGQVTGEIRYKDPTTDGMITMPIQ